MSSILRHRPRWTAVQKSQTKPQTRPDGPVLIDSPALRDHQPWQPETWGDQRRVCAHSLIGHSQTEQTGPALPTLENLEERHTHERRRKEKPQRLAFEAGNLPSSDKQSAFVRRNSGQRSGRQHVFPPLRDRLPGVEAKLHQPFALGFRGRRAMPLSLSRQVYCYITNISASCPSTTNQIKLSKHNECLGLQWIHSSKAEFCMMFPLAQNF